MIQKSDFEKISHIFQNKKKIIKPPAYQWQDLALRIIEDLKVPPFKKNSVFKICKENGHEFVEKCLDDTKELAQGENWKYFFKLVAKNPTNLHPDDSSQREGGSTFAGKK